MNSMEPTRTARSFPYSVKMERPFSETVLNTRPMMPNGAKLMIQVTTFARPLEISSNMVLVVSLAPRRPMPNKTAHTRTPM